MKKIYKSEKGAIAIIVLVSIFFFVSVIVGGVTVNSINRKAQIKYNKEIIEMYETDEAEYYDKLMIKMGN